MVLNYKIMSFENGLLQGSWYAVIRFYLHLILESTQAI